jgi:hypothetical protein
LQGSCNGFNQVFLFDQCGHDELSQGVLILVQCFAL